VSCDTTKWWPFSVDFWSIITSTELAHHPTNMTENHFFPSPIPSPLMHLCLLPFFLPHSFHVSILSLFLSPFIFFSPVCYKHFSLHHSFLPLSPSCHTLLDPSSCMLQITDLPIALNDTPDFAWVRPEMAVMYMYITKCINFLQ